MSKPQGSIINFDFSFIETFLLMAFMAMAGGGIVLVLGVKNKNPAALMVLGGLLTLLIFLLGAGLMLFVIWVVKKFERGRDLAEQERFRDNARENLATMAGLARAQNVQNQMLLRQARDLQRALPAPGDDLDLDALIVENAVFDELDEGGANHA